MFGDEIEEAEKEQIVQGLLGHGKECGFYSKCDDKLLDNFEQGSDMVKFVFQRSLWLGWMMDCEGVARAEVGRLAGGFNIT